uniref:Uncharacterized protein n=1 Tax=Akkesiphycus lubricus TaxID=3022 RepID=A0A8F0JXE4_AKKLU|nr:hypothetical protein [Akkesiphycus lubricus]
MNFILKKKDKKRQALQRLFSFKYLDKILYELLIDNIKCYNPKFILNVCSNLEASSANIILFLLCSNLFSTEELTIQLNQKGIGGHTKNNLIYSIDKETVVLNNLNRGIKDELQVTFILNLIEKKGDVINILQAQNSINILKCLDLI